MDISWLNNHQMITLNIMTTHLSISKMDKLTVQTFKEIIIQRAHKINKKLIRARIKQYDLLELHQVGKELKEVQEFKIVQVKNKEDEEFL